ncbi:MAG TPA: hypothetical protein VL095_16465 [Flavisolibacter sp.]|nr:hypothetical protein [Flavisolibacter sp.]
MERNFTDENMEEFLRRNTDSFQMRPSAKVWKGISAHLNNRRRRMGWILGTSLLLTTALGYYFINESTKNSTNSTTNSNLKTETSVTSKTSPAPTVNKDLLAANFPAKKKTKISKGSEQNEEFTFTQTLLQRNEASVQNSFTPTIVDSYFEENLTAENKLIRSEELTAVDPLSIESVLNSYKPKAKKFGWQIYLTPTVSYRKLNDNHIEDIVPHKPAFGFELGVAAKYRVASNAKLRAGLQFNVNRYEIKTFDSYAQVATIRLSDRNGTDYVRSVTNYNNFSGYKSNWLQNFYFQVSAPVGVELKLRGDDKVQLGIASTIQPTYLLGDKAYVISTDYKNYTEMPNLVRRWNINTNFETFVAYSTGHLNWQVGPQVRYQILSSYLKKYPVKENLFDFGLKVGLSFGKE